MSELSRLKRHLVFSIFYLAFFSNGFSQPGSNDPTFNILNNGTYGDGTRCNNDVRSTTIQSDGKIIVGGSFTAYNGALRNRIARVNVDGSVDASFAIGNGFNDLVISTAIQTDGKIIVGGSFTSFNGVTRNRIARLNADGTLDTSFNPSSGLNNTVQSVAIQGDGKIIVGGSFTTLNGSTRNRIARLNADGSLDASFNIGTGLNNAVNTIAIQNDGKIIIGGSFTSFNSISTLRIARINSDGSIDNTFNPGAFNNDVNAFAIQNDGKIIVGGSFSFFSSSARSRIARLNANGTIDFSFGSSTGFNNTVRSLLQKTNGEVIVGGDFSTFEGTTRHHVACISASGSLVATFNPGVFNGAILSAAEQSDGKLIVGGQFTTLSSIGMNRFTRLYSNGGNDTDFSPISGFDDIVNVSVVQSNGKIIVGGLFTMFNGVSRIRIARLNADGTLDLSFDPQLGFTTSVNALALQSDGKIIVGGFFNLFNGVSKNRIVRLNTDGSLDESFVVGTGFNNAVYSVAVQTDGKIIVGGAFTTYKGITANRIARLNTDGSLDASFSTGTGFSATVHSVSIQSDGRIIAGGSFGNFNGTTRNKIARLNTDGSLNTAFNPGTGFNFIVYTTAIQADGKIIAGGSFTTFVSATRNRIMRLTSTGGIDNTFNSGTGFNSIVHTTVIQADGKIIVGGDYTSYNGVTSNRITRLNTNGSIDASFNAGGTGFNSVVNSVALIGSGKILAGGQFSSYNDVSRNRIALISSNSCEPLTGIHVVNSCEPFTWIDGITYTQSNTTASHLVVNATQNGCDTLVTLNLTINQPSSSTIDTTIISGQSFIFNNQNITDAGTYTMTLQNAAGCDSVVTLNLTVAPILNYDFSATNTQICAGDEVTISVSLIQGTIETLDCASATNFGELLANSQANGVSAVLNYLGGNGGVHNGQTVSSTGVTGLTASLSASSFTNGGGSLTYTITGTPSAEGTANFAIAIGGQSCLLSRAVSLAQPEYPMGYVHCNANNPTQVVDVTNPATGKTWMDRNLGANRAAISSTDAESYGSLFQWGRFADGHQCVNRYAGDGVTTSSTTPTVSTSATPGHGNFIANLNAQWQMPVLNDLWQGVNGTNNPCPAGYRLPTEAELESERLSWQQAPINSTNDIVGGFASPLKFTMGGRRNNSNGGLSSVGSYGAYWSSTALAWEEISLDLTIGITFPASVEWSHNRSMAVSVRCIKN